MLFFEFNSISTYFVFTGNKSLIAFKLKNLKVIDVFSLKLGKNTVNFNKDCKLNHIHRFLIINLLFMSQNSATFDVKVAEFSVANK